MGSPPSALPTPVKSKIELKPLPASRQTQSMPKTRPNSRRLLKLTSTNTPIWLKLKARNTESNSIWTLFTPASKNNTVNKSRVLSIIKSPTPKILPKTTRLKLTWRKTRSSRVYERRLKQPLSKVFWAESKRNSKTKSKTSPTNKFKKSLNSIVTQGAKEASKAMKANGLNGNIQNKVQKEFNQNKGPAMKKLEARQKQAVRELNKKINQQKF